MVFFAFLCCFTQQFESREQKSVALQRQKELIKIVRTTFLHFEKSIIFCSFQLSDLHWLTTPAYFHLSIWTSDVTTTADSSRSSTMSSSAKSLSTCRKILTWLSPHSHLSIDYIGWFMWLNFGVAQYPLQFLCQVGIFVHPGQKN